MSQIRICEHCFRKRKHLNADCVNNLWLCDDCYSRIDGKEMSFSDWYTVMGNEIRANIKHFKTITNINKI